ncbi:MAG TPA: FAD-dependent oxidoreductase [Bacteroidota bacterium]|nr:FAD-dependent oxidoreductase [Bacteroidota bacterium]
MNKKKIVFLGAGYVGVWAYRSLLRALRFSNVWEQVHITAISPLSHHLFHGWTGEVLGGIIPPQHRMSPLSAILKRASLIQGQVLCVDLKNKVIVVQTVDSKKQIFAEYDHLIFGTGSSDNKERIPGVSRCGWALKSQDDFEVFRRHLLSVLKDSNESNDAHLQKRLLTFVIVGAGFTGVEMCASISELLQRVRMDYPVLLHRKPKIVLVHSGNHILPQLQPKFTKIASYAEKQLLNYGVEIKCGRFLKEVTRTAAILNDGTEIPSATVLCTLGQVITPIRGTEELPQSRTGRIVTDSNLNVKGYPELWAGGDVAEVLNTHSGEFCHPNALWAIEHGKRIGNNIARVILGKMPKAFSSRGLGQAASLGIFKGAGELWGFQFTGWLAWILRIVFFLWFMPSRRQAIKVAWTWFVFPFQGMKPQAKMLRREEPNIPGVLPVAVGLE